MYVNFLFYFTFYIVVDKEALPPEEKDDIYSEAEDGNSKPIPVAEFARYFKNKSENGAIFLREEFKVTKAFLQLSVHSLLLFTQHCFDEHFYLTEIIQNFTNQNHVFCNILRPYLLEERKVKHEIK